MQRVDTLESLSLNQPSLVTIGMFDGVHLGHQKLIRQLVEEAHQSHYAAVVVSFFPHPDVVLRGISGRYYLTPPDEKERLMAELGVDVLVMHPFNETVRHIRAAEFVDHLRRHLRLQALWATADFAMGYQREGTIDFLRQQGAEKGFAVRTIDLLIPEENGERVSSSHIRQALTQGDVVSATRWLGRPYRVAGEVVRGDARGRKIGFPTANTAVWEQQILPANGVYACRVAVQEQSLGAVTNIGVRPTFAGDHVTVEAHIFEFDRDIYGETLTIEFIQRLRGEQKFSGIDELVAQIRRDSQQAREILKDR
jgi:riboflavin kinase/FMN adenylyltransferase